MPPRWQREDWQPDKATIALGDANRRKELRLNETIAALRKEADERERNLQQQLRDASRQAGMAEIATNVLHNVGNVLNSVNISMCARHGCSAYAFG